MKKRDSIHLLLAAAALLLATAACTKDELADGNRLPEGQYPLEIARITLGVEGGEAQPWGTPQTRVSEIADGTGSVFDAGDLFAVQIDGKDEVGTYAVQDNNTVKAETPLYWSDTGEHTVTAWYPAKSSTIDLGNQSQSLAYLLYATGTGDYQTPVTLTFAHQLAKVRVTPSDDALGEVQSLQLYTYTQCTYEKGEVVQGSQEGWIEMKPCEYTENGATINCWEANVVPGYTITKLQANGTEERELSSGITPVAGKFYNITLDKDKGYTDDGQGNYIVTTAEGLKAVADIANNGNLGINITLTENINLTDMDWTPIGIDYNHQYTGTFNGGGHTITGLTVTGSDQYVGLFGHTGTFNGGGHTITGLTVTGSDQYVGLFGHIGSGGTVKDVTLEEVKIESNNDMSAVGGVVGSNTSCTLKACYAWGSVTGSGSGTIYVGGVTGTNDEGTLTACYHANGTVSGPAGTTGGVAGRNYKFFNDPVITACYWGSNPDTGIGYNEGGSTTIETTKVTDGDWLDAVAQMNTALNESGWQYELTGALPTLKKQ